MSHKLKKGGCDKCKKPECKERKHESDSEDEEQVRVVTGCGDVCCIDIVFINVPDPAGFGPIYPILLKVKETYPSRNLKFEYVPRATAATLDQAVQTLDKAVKKWYCKGYRYISIPDQTLLSQNWALGLAGGLGGVPASIRYPEAVFIIQNAGFPLLGEPGTENIYRFSDVETQNDESLIIGNLTTLVTPGGVVFYTYTSDPQSIAKRDVYAAAAAAAGLTFIPILITLTQAGINAIVAQVEAEAPVGVTSVLAHGPNGLDGPTYNALASTASPHNLFDTYGGRIVNFGANFSPSVANGTVPVELFSGISVVDGVPSEYQASLGFPLDMQGYQALPYNLDYIESYVWAATCGKTEGVLDKQLKIDNNHTRIAYWLADTLYPANSINPIVTDFIQNGRWVNELAPAI